MNRIGLTGGLATGKSTVLRLFAASGAAVIDSDRLCREIVSPYQEAWRDVYDFFGSRYFARDMSLKRDRLKELVFSSEAARDALNHIIHPRIKTIIAKDLEKLALGETPDLVLVDVPLLFEVGWQDWFDKTVLVYARPDVQVERLVKRDGVAPDEARQWLAAQMSIDEKKRLANFVIENSGPVDDTRRQVMLLSELFRRRSYGLAEK